MRRVRAVPLFAIKRVLRLVLPQAVVDSALDVDSKGAVAAGDFHRRVGHLAAGFLCRSEGGLNVVYQPVGSHH